MADLRQLHRDATVFLQQGNPERAIEHLLGALRSRPDDLPLRSLLGDLYARLGHAGAAIECYRVVAGAYASAGHLLPAIAACRAILNLDRTHTGTQKLLADLYARQTSAPSAVKVPAPRPSVEARAVPPAPSAPVYALPGWLEDEPDVPTITGVEVPEVYELDSAELSVDPGALPHVPLFSDLSRKAFVWLLPRLEVRRVLAGDVVAEEGDFGDSLFIVVSGTLRVEKRRKDGPPLVLNLLKPNSFFGEIALLGSGVRSATVVADTDAQLLELTRPVLDELLEEHPGVNAVMRRFYRERLFSDLMKTSPLFRTVQKDQVRALVARFKEVTADRGTRLQVEGKKATGLHVILDGRCEVSRLVDGRRQTLSELGPGDLFGGTSFLTGELPATTVTARVRTTALVVPTSAAPEVLSQHPQVRDLLALVKDAGEKVMDSAVASAKSGKTGKTAAIRHLQGDLGQLKPTSLLVFFEMERMTGVLRLDTGKAQASLFINGGRIYDVEAPGRVEDPVAKVSEVLGWEKGTFDFAFGPVDREDRVKTGTTGLLLEAARVADEAAAARGG